MRVKIGIKIQKGIEIARGERKRDRDRKSERDRDRNFRTCSKRVDIDANSCSKKKQAKNIITYNDCIPCRTLSVVLV